MTRTLNDLPEAPEVRFRLDVQPTKDWLNLYHFRGTALPEHALNLLRTRIDGTMGFGQLPDSDGRTVAITRAHRNHLRRWAHLARLFRRGG